MIDKLKKIDKWMVLLLLAFMVASTFIVYSATRANERFVDMEIKNLINYALGFLVCFLIMQINYRVFVRFAHWIYIGVIILLCLVFVFGVEINGAKGWFRIGIGFDIQPAELMKLALILFLAQRLGSNDGEPLRFFDDVLPLAIWVGLPFLLVVIQPDLGNAIIYFIIAIGMLWIANVRIRHVMIGLMSVMILIGTLLWFYHTNHAWFEENLKSHWVQRLDTFLDPTAVSKDASYQLDNSIRAIGSGGLTGEGYLQGSAVQKKFIPYPYSDSIFVVIAEEFGFVGASVLIFIYFMFLARMISIAQSCRDRTGAYIVIGILSMLLFQIFENIGMLIGIMPLTGITLPLISYGGSSLLMNMACIGIVFSIQIHQNKLDEYLE